MFVRKWDSWLADGLCLEFSRGGALACEVCPWRGEQSMMFTVRGGASSVFGEIDAR